MKEKLLQSILENTIDRKKVFGTSFCVKYKDETWCGAAGNLTSEQQFFIASTTKLYITAIILNLKAKGLLNLEDNISIYLDKWTMNKLHHYKGVDYSKGIFIRQLLAHTSCIPDYFQQKDVEGNSIESEITEGKDQSWTFDEAIAHSKNKPPLFIPEAKGKAHYSDTNFQLLGRIIETVTNKSVAENLEEIIFTPLGLTKTYLYSDVEDRRPRALYFKNKELLIPKAMTSFGADGGIVSTASEVLKFLEAFFNGTFFPVAYIDQLKNWNKIFFPMQAGVGIHKFKLPWFFDPFNSIPELIGHSGLSGALAYYSPEKDLYIAGTVNQVAYPDTSFKLAIKLIQKALAE